MPVEYLSAEQKARYRRFATEPSPGELEQFFRLDTKALGLTRAKRRPASRLGWAVQALSGGGRGREDGHGRRQRGDGGDQISHAPINAPAPSR
ncbi:MULTISPECIES: DUF4158 domain-containing protein [unclassified Streptomyces]|uniref:DUF4158 domain-containing protein n=1 Tax=unclassified Streptomyces TaxID=2593676 RepID=UPI001C378E1D